MKSVSVILQLKPLSYNGYYKNTKSGFRIKTGAGLAYDEKLDCYLEQYEDELKEFGQDINPQDYTLELSINIFNPDFFIKDMSRLNMKSGDIDNVVKVLQDKIFKMIQIDDYYVKKLSVEDHPSDMHAVIVEIIRRPIPKFLSFDNIYQ